MESSHFSQKVRSAYVWTFGGTLIRQLLAFGLAMLLARFLEPADYGLIGMVLVFTGILSAVQDLGFGQAVVYFKDTESALPTYYTVTTLMGTLMCGITFAFAPVVAAFYDSPPLIPIMRWLSVTLFFAGLRSVSQGLMTKQFQFRHLTLIEGGCGLFSAGVAVYMAWRGFGVWSLVTNLVLASFLQTAIFTVLAPPRLTWHVDMALTKKILRWGIPLTGSTFLWKIYDNADYMIIGKLLGKEPLGFYTLAFRLATLVNEKIGAIVSRVSFPSFAALQDNPRQAIAHWLSVTRKSALLSFPLLFLLAVTAEDVVRVVLSEKWLPCVFPLRLLCVVGVLRVLTPVTISLLSASGRTDTAFQYSLLNAVVMPISFVIGCLLGGINGVAIAWIVVFPFICLFLLGRTIAITKGSWGEYLRNLWLPVMTSVVAAGAVLPTHFVLESGMVRLAVSGLLGGTAYAAALLSTAEGRSFIPERLRLNRQAARV